MIGIGGIGMSGLARYFNMRGISVSGYDKVSTPLTDQLIAEGIPIHFTEDITAIPGNIDLVIYTPAIPVDHKELVFLQNNGTPVKKRAEILMQISEGQYTVAVAGTHGKTTISSMITHILHHTEKELNAFVGGMMKNYQSNFIGSDSNGVYVIEADEYDRSFLKLFPDIAVISSMDADHLDIYGDKKTMVNTFRQFATQVKPGGVLIINKKLSGNFSTFEDIFSYAVGDPADYAVTEYNIESGQFVFDLKLRDEIIKDICFRIPGKHNIENAVAAAAVCKEIGLSAQDIKSGLESYQGVARRFDIRINEKDFVYIDDYAHHPEEIKSCISAVRDFYPGKKVTGIFQPHLFTRTRDFAEEFAKSLDLLDDAILLDIYPAREEPVEGVTSGLIMDLMKLPVKELSSKEQLLDIINER
ncbi:MAG: UDP-N-acetylmuramate--L-alanine ligase, partial [Bacteroidota bacterium]|nr:UDP-N-acetylmuramate--L-alanine ligase [Bacteroidota bacterium]